MSATSLRTQITLSKELRREIDKYRRASRESLAGYIRRAVEDQIKMDAQKKVDLKKLADEVIGSIKPGDGGWGDVDMDEWRKERYEEDAIAMKRLDKITKSSSRKKKSKQCPIQIHEIGLKLGDK